MNTISFFEIQSSNPERDVAFYSAIFGWTFEKMEGMPITYYSISTPNMWGGLLERPAPIPALGTGTNAYVCSIQVADFDTTAEKIMTMGGKIALPKFAIPGKCWQGYFLDADNNTFGIFQVDKTAGV